MWVSSHMGDCLTRRTVMRMLATILVATSNGFAAAERFAKGPIGLLPPTKNALAPELIEDPALPSELDDIWECGLKYWDDAVARVQAKRRADAEESALAVRAPPPVQEVEAETASSTTVTKLNDRLDI